MNCQGKIIFLKHILNVYNVLKACHHSCIVPVLESNIIIMNMFSGRMLANEPCSSSFSKKEPLQSFAARIFYYQIQLMKLQVNNLSSAIKSSMQDYFFEEHSKCLQCLKGVSPLLCSFHVRKYYYHYEPVFRENASKCTIFFIFKKRAFIKFCS